MEPARRSILLGEARNILLSRIPLNAPSSEVVGAQAAIFDDGLQRFHVTEYNKALQLFHAANEVQENNSILFAISVAYYLTGKYEDARLYADRIEVEHCGPGCAPESADVDILYLLIEAQAAGWEEQEDRYRQSGKPPEIYVPPDLLHIFISGNSRKK